MKLNFSHDACNPKCLPKDVTSTGLSMTRCSGGDMGKATVAAIRDTGNSVVSGLSKQKEARKA
jgi:hypothetical protein